MSIEKEIKDISNKLIATYQNNKEYFREDDILCYYQNELIDRLSPSYYILTEYPIYLKYLRYFSDSRCKILKQLENGDSIIKDYYVENKQKKIYEIKTDIADANDRIMKFFEYAIDERKIEACYVDIAIIKKDKYESQVKRDGTFKVDAVIEFKYEINKKRREINIGNKLPTIRKDITLPKLSKLDIIKDILKLEYITLDRMADEGYFIFVDEDNKIEDSMYDENINLKNDLIFGKLRTKKFLS